MHLRLIGSLAGIAAADWDALHDGSNPFVSHTFLAGLESHGCLRREWGWTPMHAALEHDGQLIAAAPGYLKENSHGEFVFDHAWAAAYHPHGIDYYPKWLLAVPYSPVAGPRLLGCDIAAKQALADALPAAAQRLDVSSVHANFLTGADSARFDPQHWIARNDIQFHWRNTGWSDFGEFLASLTHKRRKSIRQERERTARAGYRFRIVHGDEASEADLVAMHAFYCMTFSEKGNSPALTLGFLQHLARTMPRALVLVLAEREDRIVAGAMCLRGVDCLYGRYWGSDEASPGLHFETCYYQGIEYCLRHGLSRFEPGAQGEHKLARGFMPQLTESRHLLLDPAFAAAIRPWCAEEQRSVARYRELLMGHTPFRHDDPVAPPAS